MWRDAELEVIAELDCRARGVVRVQRNRLLDVRRCGAVLRKLDAAGGNGTASAVQLARHLYADVGDAWDAGDRLRAFDLARGKRASIFRWLDVLAAQGVIQYVSLPGKGFRWRFLPVPTDVARMASARGCSSVGWSYSQAPHEGRRRRGVSPETRVRRWCPRAGRGSVYEPPRRSPFFSTPEFDDAGASPLKGESFTATDARTRGPDQPSAVHAAIVASLSSAAGVRVGSDAISRACPADQRAALRRLRQLTDEGEVEALRAAGHDDAPFSALALALWAWRFPGREPRFSTEASAQLERTAGQLARLWSRADVVDRLVDAIAAPHFYGDDPMTLRYFVLSLKQSGRQARRHARRRPPPRPHKPRGRA